MQETVFYLLPCFRAESFAVSSATESRVSPSRVSGFSENWQNCLEILFSSLFFHSLAVHC